MGTNQPWAPGEQRWFPGQLAAGTPAGTIATLINWCAEDARRRAAGHRVMLPAQHAAAEAARVSAAAAAERLICSRRRQEEALARWRGRKPA
jgi:hypothetical protein